MKPYIKTGESAASAANAPASSLGVGAAAPKTKSKSKTTRKTATDGETKVSKSKTKRTTITETVEAVTPTQPDFGEFRCLCCGYTKTVAFGTEKPANGWRCPACFVKLAWLKS